PAATTRGRLPPGSRSHRATPRPLPRWYEFAAGRKAPHIVSLAGHGLRRHGEPPRHFPRREAAERDLRTAPQERRYEDRCGPIAARKDAPDSLLRNAVPDRTPPRRNDRSGTGSSQQ